MKHKELKVEVVITADGPLGEVIATIEDMLTDLRQHIEEDRVTNEIKDLGLYEDIYDADYANVSITITT